MTTKTEEAYNLIKKEILAGRLNNREAVSVSLMSTRLGMSKTPVRDAFRELESEGFVRIIPNQGIVIQELSVLEATQMYELRIALEGYMIQKTLPMLEQYHFERLRELLGFQEQAMKDEDSFEFMKYDNMQHLFLHEVYFNPMIFDVLHRLTDRIFYGGVQALRLPGRMEATLQEHVDIIEALENKDLNGAIRALEYHFNKGLSSTTISLGLYLQG